jgi:phage-related minor tail protein
MADRIKGITVEIGGDTTGLSKALSGVNKEIRNTQSQLTDVNRLLKLDPTNSELLSQKQKLLSQAVGETKEKLTQLKSVQDQMDAGLKNGSVTQEQYDAWQREIIATEQELKGLEQQCKKTDTSVSATLKQAGSKMQEVGGKISEVGEGLTTHVTAPIVAVGAASLAAFNEVDSGLDIIEQKTGATGQALGGHEPNRQRPCDGNSDRL